LPLVITLPSVVADREELIRMDLIAQSQKSKDSSSAVPFSQLIFLQRQLRAVLLKSYLDNRKKEGLRNTSDVIPSLSNSLSTNYFSEFLSINSYYRARKQNRREIRNSDRDDRRKRGDIDEKKRKKQNDYFKALMDHRDSFLKFHKGCKAGNGRLVVCDVKK